jgi:hypothetical protein
MNAEAHNDAHHNEYLAAIAGLPDQTISQEQLPAVGDFVSGRTGGKHWSGRVMESEPNRLHVEIDGGWIVVHPRDITH